MEFALKRNFCPSSSSYGNCSKHCFPFRAVSFGGRQHISSGEQRRDLQIQECRTKATISVRHRCYAAQTEAAPRSDDVLPDSFLEALEHAAQSTKAAIDSGADRCLVEILLLGLWDPSSGNLFAEEGDQQRFWKITRKFIEQMSVASGPSKIKALYPDMGVAAMLRNEWKDRDFEIAAISERSAVAEGDDLVIIAAVDPQGLNEAKRVAAGSSFTPVILFNPRLASGDVGLGLNVRRMRNEFLSTFQITYSLRPVNETGTVFRRFPGTWKVFKEDASSPGRYDLAAEFRDQPTGDDLDQIFENGDDNADGQDGQGIFNGTKSAVNGFVRFLSSLSK
ncbi:hypothetical protein COCSUDRAFT_65935 [Coccomyxa subellipsoidea C-169]|uniref:DUF1995 domain-containing protein n=1 Tax=Coccomyxa subellipsoidea (strain C-169) TaxID=574566 RepID=I0YYK8_COCSC|nr:hypothetical protein COCSUDRAFT_65935 [Coccomyxa subellipsoidea C-169]EIE23477.1 hypothetical protein COCSUDRAFT_65935 [Coccomyxa subellipsoidea C-169]|eukprot:XP_005648021.1 hypothetical protein COCSUDRAFT_65935 [Coccomyxa subellipsoidea C-169]